MKNEEELYDELVKLINEKIKKWKTEREFAILLDKGKNIIGSCIASDTYYKYSVCLVYNIIDKYIKEKKLHPYYIVTAHNHPTNYEQPSDADFESCRSKCINMKRILGLIHYDSIIITRETDWVFSFRKETDIFNDTQE